MIAVIVWAIQDDTLKTAIATVIATVIASGSAYLTKRSSDKSNEAISQAQTKADLEKSRTDIEREAFQRAEQFLQHTIERQDRELAEAEAKIEGLQARVSECERLALEAKQQAAHNQRLAKRLARGVHELQQAIKAGEGHTVLDKSLADTVLEVLSEE